jgi:hypothetical protein
MVVKPWDEVMVRTSTVVKSCFIALGDTCSLIDNGFKGATGAWLVPCVLRG